MTTSLNNKLSGIYEFLLPKICLYYSFGPESLKEVASLFNRNHGEKLSAKQIKDAYEYMHNAKHPSFEKARDMNRDNRKQCEYLQQRLKVTMSKMQLTLHL